MSTAQKTEKISEVKGKFYVRRQPRFHCDLELEIRIPGFADFIPVTMKNISMGGMFCEIPKESLPGEGHVFEFRIDGKKSGQSIEDMVGLGLIQWVRPLDLKSQHSGVGIEFKVLPIETAKFIKKAISKARKNGIVP